MLLQKETFEIVRLDNGVYFGEFSGHKRQGMGVMVTEEWIFEGCFDRGQKTRGAEMTYDGIYRGTFNAAGQREGKGRFDWNNG